MRYFISQRLYDTYAQCLSGRGKGKIKKNGKWIEQTIPATYEEVLAYLNETAGILGGITELSIDKAVE